MLIIISPQIVDDDSATLGFACERKQWIPANHSEMCKFKCDTDHGYVRVAGGIRDLVEDAVGYEDQTQIPPVDSVPPRSQSTRPVRPPRVIPDERSNSEDSAEPEKHTLDFLAGTDFSSLNISSPEEALV